MLSWFDTYFKFETPQTLFFFFLGTRLFAVTLTFGEVYVIATKQNIFLQNSWLPLFSAFLAFDLYRFQLRVVPSTPQIFRDSISEFPNEKIENLRSKFPWAYIIRDQFDEVWIENV